MRTQRKRHGPLYRLAAAITAMALRHAINIVVVAMLAWYLARQLSAQRRLPKRR